jgi:hypothetical protein
MLIFGSRNGGDVGPPTGWTNVLGVSTFGSFLTASCLPVTATQSALSVVDISGSSNGSIAHALVST